MRGTSVTSRLDVRPIVGYYARARNLHRAVREIEARYDGWIPGDPDELRGLPGIGAYTAGAVASIAFDVPVPAVDGNVRRVLARLADDPAPPLARLERWASRLVDPDRPGAFNQDLMELGSTLCTARAPVCGSCPAGRWCRARQSGTVEMRPRRNPKRGVPTLTEAVVILVDLADGDWRILLRKRPEQGLLAGLWEFPGRPVGSRRSARAEALTWRGSWWGRSGGRRTESGLRPMPGTRWPVCSSVARPSRYPLSNTPSLIGECGICRSLVSVDGACRDEGPESGMPRTGGGESGSGSGRPVGGAPRWIHRGEESDLALPSAQRELLRRAWDQLSELARRRRT